MSFRAPVGAAWLMCGAALTAVTPASAKTISITIGQRAEIRGDTLVVKTTVGNTGDEAAKSVKANLRFGDETVGGKLHDELEPNGKFEEELAITTGRLGDGRWPYAIAVDYADANLYPFQALLMSAIVVGSPPPAKLSIAELKAEPIATSGPLSITFKNLSGTEREVSYRVVVPEGLEAAEPSGRVNLTGWGQAELEVELVNRTALAGSRYPIFVAVEYDDGGVHQGIVSQNVVEIVAPRNFWEENQTLLIVGAGILVALWLVLVVRGAMSRKT
jgi:hypothetical protein